MELLITATHKRTRTIQSWTLCDRRSSSLAVSMCGMMSVTGYFAITSNAQNSLFPPFFVVNSSCFRQTVDSWQTTPLLCVRILHWLHLIRAARVEHHLLGNEQATSPSRASLGNITLTNTFGDTAFNCTGANCVCVNTRFTKNRVSWRKWQQLSELAKLRLCDSSVSRTDNSSKYMWLIFLKPPQKVSPKGKLFFSHLFCMQGVLR